MALVNGVNRFVDASVLNQKAGGAGPWVVEVTFTPDEAGKVAAQEFCEAVKDGNLYGVDPDAWRKKHGHDHPPQTSDASLSE
jgi:hypothetical protein